MLREPHLLEARMRQRGNAGRDQQRRERARGSIRGCRILCPSPGDLLPSARPCIMCVLQEPSSDTSQSSPFFLQFLANITTSMDAPILCTLFLIYQHSNTSQCPHVQAQTLLCPLSTPLVPLQPQDSVHASCRSLPAPDPPSSSLDPHITL